MYLSGAGAASGYLHLLRQDLYECDSAFVIGYSMADPNLAEIFFNTADLLNKCFVFSGRADELSAHRIALVGTDTGLSLADFVGEIQSRPADSESPLPSDLMS